MAKKNFGDRIHCYHQLEVFKAHFCHKRLAYCIYKKQRYWDVFAINKHQDGWGIGICIENVCTLSSTFLLEITISIQEV
jgi:hypothetical protein